MACYHPLKGFVIGLNENGKKNIKIRPYDVECIGLGRKGSWEDFYTIIDPNVSSLYSDYKIISEFIPIPCGQCIGCRLEHSRQWAVRCMLETEYHDNNYFITLTYDDKHVPINHYIDNDGCFTKNMTLKQEDMQLFIKRLRRHFDYNDENGFRYFYCGEYGETSARPHYHMIAFGLDLPDLKLYKETPLGNYYTSDILTEKWGNGIVIVGGVSFESCSYVSRYIMKKQKGKGASVYEENHMYPEYIRMSRRPGIGKQYFEDNFNDIYPNDKIVLSGGKLSVPPRYFDYLMNQLDEEIMNDVKLKRKDIAEKIQSYKEELTSADYQNQLLFAENNKKAQISKLVRPLNT